MDKRVKELVDFTSEKWGLENYYLHTYNFYRKLNSFNETIYTLTMEWFPSHITDWVNEDYNPDGTASIDLNVNSRQFESVIFVGGKSYSNKNLFHSLKTNDIIKWIEKETGLKYGCQFELKKEEDGEFYFQSSIGGIAVSPCGTIEIKVDQVGKMTFFSLYGKFPSKETLVDENFSLNLDDLGQIVKDQLELIEYPVNKQNRIIPIYVIEEIFVRNDLSVIPFDFDRGKFKLKIKENIQWQPSNTRPSFKRTLIGPLNEDFSIDQAFSCEPHPDLLLISDDEITKCIIGVRDFLCSVFPKDSGKWLVETLHRDEGYIIAILKENDQERQVFQGKLKLFIDTTTFMVLNYIDNKFKIEMIEGFQQIENISINKDTAFETIKSKIELISLYVFDFEQNKFIRCGKIDSDFCVNASNGEIIALADYL
ncbi:hypothetical protein [Bacillus sp. AFS041924]|uniref:hypothetical protein n=1 Tax=Bacillus sp. AFS041924 TaxID=2033503 RepID=UPI000BFD21AC|nr:hypothetical protein [Bacillus sp. AFS041924]PGS49316.1 hypothetical protein COC46_15590 [Bacillus sp. AFS041924]